MNTTYRADQFLVGSLISVVGVPSLHKLELTAVTASAAHVINNGVHTTISCATPCVSYVEKEKEVSLAEHSVAILENDVDIASGDVNVSEVIDEVSEKTGRRGRPQGVHGKMIADKLATFVFPSEPFTIKQIADMLETEPLYLINFVKEKCVEVGEAEKIAGRRGRAPKLFLLKK